MSIKTLKTSWIIALVSYSIIIVMKAFLAANRGIIIADIVDMIVDIGILVLLTIGYFMGKKHMLAKEAASRSK